MPLTVQTDNDWNAIAAIGGPVVDPMIVRCGELFLRGAANAQNNAAAWDLMDKNIHALGTFFDRIILDEKIPVFNYTDSFDMGQNFDSRTLARVNDKGQILVDVDVNHAAYMEVKNAALAELKSLYESGLGRVDAPQAAAILGELTTSGYAWYPQLGDMAFPSDEERRLAAYILGGLVFGAYAQLAGANHLMQPKRSRLFIALSLHQDTSRSAEDYLFSRLGELAGHPTAEIPYTPTFFPLLLEKSTGPAEVLKNALEMRSSAEVKDYRAWLREALDDFRQNGRIPAERVREVDRIAAAISRKLEGAPFPKVEIKTTVADVAALKAPGVGIDLTAPARAAWGWTINQLPGKRHRKLLTRAVIADRDYVRLDLRLNTVWNGPGLSA
jgi:hypothetical protein